MNPLIIECPDYPESVQITTGRRAQYYLPGEKLPKKLQTGVYKWSLRNDQQTLYDSFKQEFVVKNSMSLKKPRFVTVAGNDIMRMSEFSRAKIVITLKEYFLEKLATWNGEYHTDGKGKKRKTYTPLYTFENSYPLRVSMEVHTFPGSANWDTDNLWIYTKCFLDAMKEGGCIPDDNIRYVTNSGEVQFIPVTSESEQKMVFRIEENFNRHLDNHILYNLLDSTRVRYELLWKTTGTPGDIIVDKTEQTITMILAKNPQKRVLGLEKAFKKVAYQCIQLNRNLKAPSAMIEEYREYFSKFLFKHGIHIYSSD